MHDRLSQERRIPQHDALCSGTNRPSGTVDDDPVRCSTSTGLSSAVRT